MGLVEEYIKYGIVALLKPKREHPVGVSMDALHNDQYGFTGLSKRRNVRNEHGQAILK